MPDPDFPIRMLQAEAYENARNKGFHDRLNDLTLTISRLDDADDAKPLVEDALRRHVGNMLMLIVGEVSEAHEEIRSLGVHEWGDTRKTFRPVPASLAVEFTSGAAAQEHWESTQVPKPEGLPSELADIFIRLADLAEALSIDLGRAVVEKMNYNATRPHMHGRLM